MSQHYPRVRRYCLRPEGERLWIREVVRLVLHLPFNHHELAGGVRRAFDVYLRAVGMGPDIFSEYNLGYEPDGLHEEAWERIRNQLSSSPGEFFLDDLEEDEVYPFIKSGFDRSVELAGYNNGTSGYGFFYRARNPWRDPDDEVSLVSFSWPSEYLEEHGPGRMRELIMELAALVPFSSGHAGLGFYSPGPYFRSLEGIRDEAFRYPGLDVTHGTTSLGCQVDGVHWLNFLGQPVLGEVGGAAGLRSRVHSPGTTVQEMEGERAVVTLGPWPEAGDLTQGQDLPTYRELARVLAPWLYECPSYRTFDGASHEETVRWYRRFLD
ncbi:type VI immunity family protein [Archangium sp.]|uniref:type VI immunity family protein n=1 Tax=Archangium sp. TaxID=1872627 RepID=UPI003899C90A